MLSKPINITISSRKAVVLSFLVVFTLLMGFFILVQIFVVPKASANPDCDVSDNIHITGNDLIMDNDQYIANSGNQRISADSGQEYFIDADNNSTSDVFRWYTDDDRNSGSSKTLMVLTDEGNLKVDTRWIFPYYEGVVIVEQNGEFDMSANGYCSSGYNIAGSRSCIAVAIDCEDPVSGPPPYVACGGDDQCKTETFSSDMDNICQNTPGTDAVISCACRNY